MKQPKLLEIGVSHYCEKARWALEYHRLSYTRSTHPPFVSRLVGRRYGFWATVPVLLTDTGPIFESTGIIEWADKHGKSDSLMGQNPEDQATIRAWIQLFDQKLGPATRRLAYYHLFSNPPLDDECLLAGVGDFEKAVTKPFLPAIKTLMRKGLKIDQGGAERSLRDLKVVWDKVQTGLSTGRPFLVGNRFSAADLTFAALSVPVLFCEPYGVPLPALERFSRETQKEIQVFRNSIPGNFAIDLYGKFREDPISQKPK